MQKACVIGFPIKHSRSPLIHNYWLQQLGIKGTYEKLEVPPDQLSAFLHSMAENGYTGCNVTIPHKEEVFEHVIINDELTKQIGAVNTIYTHDGKKYGLNTDAYGFISNLKDGCPEWTTQQQTCVLIGAGGAARAIVAALKNDGAKAIHIFNRTVVRAKALAKVFGDKVYAHDFSDLNSILPEADLLVNSTSLGMAGQPPLTIRLQHLPKSCVVTDIVYTPLQTELLLAAKSNGNQIVDGIGMLLHQAVPGFEKWFGIRPEVTAKLRQLVLKDLQDPKS